MTEQKQPFKMTVLTAIVGEDDNGEEGVWGFLDPVNRTWIAMISADEERMKIIYPQALAMSKDSGRPFKVLQFSVRTDITQEVREKYTPKAKASIVDLLYIYVIFDHPSDYPDHYLIKRDNVATGDVVRDPDYLFLAKTLDECQNEMIRLQLCPLPLSPDDDPVIIQTWI